MGVKEVTEKGVYSILPYSRFKLQFKSYQGPLEIKSSFLLIKNHCIYRPVNGMHSICSLVKIYNNCCDPTVGLESFYLHCLAKDVFSPVPPYWGDFVPSHSAFSCCQSHLFLNNLFVIMYLKVLPFHCSIFPQIPGQLLFYIQLILLCLYI